METKLFAQSNNVCNDSMFYPEGLAAGTYPITYTLTDANGCTSSAVDSLVVYQSIIATLPASLGTICNNSPSTLALTGGSPAGGTYSGPGVSGSVFNPAAAPLGINIIYYSVMDSLGCVGQASSSSIFVNNCVGIVNQIENTELKVYPNPFTDEATFVIGSSVVLKDASLHVYDILGKEVVSLVNIQNHEFKMQRNNMTTGIYFYRLVNDSKMIGSGKLMIK